MIAAQVVPMIKNPPVNAGDVRDMDSIRISGRSPREGNGNPLEFLPGDFHGQWTLAGSSPWGCKKLDTTEAT